MRVVQVGYEPGFDGGHTMRDLDQSIGRDRTAFETTTDRPRSLVTTDHGDDLAGGTKTDDVARNVTGAADHVHRPRSLDHRRRRLGRDARDMPIDEPVEHDVADHKHALAAELIENGLE